MKDLTTPAEKLAWLRDHVDPLLPDIYAMAGKAVNSRGEVLTMNGCGPESWSFGRVRFPATATFRLLGYPLTLSLVPNKFAGLPCLELAGDYHDFLYWKGGTAEDRLCADQWLRLIMQMLADEDWCWYSPDSWMDQTRMAAISQAYFLAVRSFGAGYFNHINEAERSRDFHLLACPEAMTCAH